MNAAIETRPASSSARVCAQLIELLNIEGMKTITDSRGVDARLVGMGISDNCTRCGGSGNFGPLCVNSGKCFKCNGAKVQAPRYTKALIVRVCEAIERGELTAYAARMQAAAKAKREAKGAFDCVFKSYSHTAWYRFFYGERPNDGTYFGQPLSHCLVDLVEPAKECAHNLDFKIRFGQGNEEVVRECLAAVAEYAKAYEQLDRAHTLCMERGLYEQATAERLAAKALEIGSYEAGQKVYAKWAKVAAEIWAEVA
jgi:hypothetical protein